MKRFKNILYFADGASEPCDTLARAVNLADDNKARLTVVDVIDQYPADLELERRLGFTINQLLHDSRLEDLMTLIEPHQQEGRLIYTQILTGIPFVEVIQTVIHNGFDLVIKATRPPEGLTDRLLGSTDLHLLRKCPCPVWIDRPGKSLPYNRVLAAVDPMSELGEARLILDLATSLADNVNADLKVLHSWNFTAESTLRGGLVRIPAVEVDRMVLEEKNNHIIQFDKLLEGYDMSTEHPAVHLIKGMAVPNILAAAEDADLIVMGTVGRTGIPGLFIGNTAEDVMQNTQASILAVKPDCFRSPLA